jgi:peptidyl-prolyl cis-trans isomerase B (cyclophilin B)
VETWRVYQVSLVTSRGDIVFELDSALAPCTANNFRSLAHFRFFDKTPCHRLTTVALRVLQCGDPTGTGRGGPGYSFADEEQSGVTYPRGTVAMASGGPDTNGSQFFIVYGDSNLPTNFTVFGQVTAGMRILDGIAAGGSDGTYGRGDGRPLSPVDITTVRVQPSARPAASPTGR